MRPLTAADGSSVFLVRHGATAWSQTGRHTGTTDVALTEQGVRDGEALRSALGGISFALVASSPRVRALETCRQAGLDAQAEVWDDLAEWDYGDYEGLTNAAIRARRPGWGLFRDGAPRGESPAQIAARADRVVERVVEQVASAGADAALFAHGHFLRVLAVRWVGWPVEAGLHLLLDTGTISVLGEKRGDRVIRTWNAGVVAGPG